MVEIIKLDDISKICTLGATLKGRYFWWWYVDCVDCVDCTKLCLQIKRYYINIVFNIHFLLPKSKKKKILIYI